MDKQRMLDNVVRSCGMENEMIILFFFCTKTDYVNVQNEQKKVLKQG